MIMPIAIAITSILFPFSSFGSDFEKIRNKIDSRLDTNKTQTRSLNNSSETKINIPWNVLDQRNVNFWNSVTSAYDLLMKNSQKERYNFLYEAAKASQRPYPENIDTLQNWINNEDKRVYTLGLSLQFYQQWKLKVSDIKTSIIELTSERPQIKSVSNERNLIENKNFLESLRIDLNNLEKTIKPIVTKVAPQKTEANSSNQDKKTDSTTGWALFSLVIGFFAARKIYKANNKTFAKRTNNEQNAVKVEPLEKTITNFHELNLEDAFQSTLKNNSHLIEIANLKLVPYTASSFRNSLNISEEKISDGLHYFLKGAIALANGTQKAPTHVDWNCAEKMGRLYLEVNLHGLQSDQKSLYMNALLDGTGSAPAHFGRTEQLLAEALPVVSMRSTNKKTTVTLSLEGNLPSSAH